jgi:hypothetical protein
MPHPDKVYHEHVVRLCQLAGDDGVLDGFEFTGCQIKGPAVLALQGQTNLTSSNLGGPTPDAILWEIPHSRPVIVGAILVNNCTFDECTFEKVGFAGPPEFIEMISSGAG